MINKKISHKEYYNQIAQSYDNLHSTEQIKKYNTFLQFLKKNTFDEIYDVGGGSGLFLEYLLKNNFLEKLKLRKYILIDTSNELIKIAKKKTENIKISKEIDFICEDAFFLFKLLSHNKNIDNKKLLISFTAIQNFDNPKEFIKKTIQMCNSEKYNFFYSILKKSQFGLELQNSCLKKEITNMFEDDKDIYLTNL